VSSIFSSSVSSVSSILYVLCVLSSVVSLQKSSLEEECFATLAPHRGASSSKKPCSLGQPSWHCPTPAELAAAQAKAKAAAGSSAAPPRGTPVPVAAPRLSVQLLLQGPQWLRRSRQSRQRSWGSQRRRRRQVRTSQARRSQWPPRLLLQWRRPVPETPPPSACQRSARPSPQRRLASGQGSWAQLALPDSPGPSPQGPTALETLAVCARRAWCSRVSPTSRAKFQEKPRRSGGQSGPLVALATHGHRPPTGSAWLRPSCPCRRLSAQ
jgi:hypothetical protein